MAQQRTCDLCGNAGARPVVVMIQVTGAVREGLETGTSLGGDLCEKCFKKGAGQMFEKVRGRIMRDIPIHQQVHDTNDEIAALEQSLRGAVRAKERVPEGAHKEHAAAQAEVDRLSVAIAVAEQKRTDLLKSAD